MEGLSRVQAPNVMLSEQLGSVTISRRRLKSEPTAMLSKPFGDTFSEH